MNNVYSKLEDSGVSFKMSAVRSSVMLFNALAGGSNRWSSLK